MAVPKKRRVTKRLLNRTLQFRAVYSNLWALGARPKAVFGPAAVSAPLDPLTQTAVVAPVSYNPFEDPAVTKIEEARCRKLRLGRIRILKPAAYALNLAETGRHLSFVAASRLFSPRLRPVQAMGYFACKEALFLGRVSHTWGVQRYLLLREYRVRPSYLAMLPEAGQDTFLTRQHVGPLAILLPQGLAYPTGLGAFGALNALRASPRDLKGGVRALTKATRSVRRYYRRWYRFVRIYATFRNVFSRTALAPLARANDFEHARVAPWRPFDVSFF